MLPYSITNPQVAWRACPVCEFSHARRFAEIDSLIYWACPDCDSRFLDPAMRPARDVESAHYGLHRNDADDARYRNFLSRAVTPLLAVLPSGSAGLDFGCGPGPALAAMLTEAGHHMRLYDPMFTPDESALQRTYDFITCTEVIEHFHYPAAEFARLNRLLRPGGLLCIMTCFQTDDARFADWWYRKDPTHVVFYRESTLRFIAARYGWRCSFPIKDVAIFEKPGKSTA
jgi:SAM-dependent methyltransferase